MLNKGWLAFVAFILLMIAIWFGGPRLSAWVDSKYREKIEKNGVRLKAVVFDKRTHKGNTVHFEYYFKDLNYRNHEQDEYWFKILGINDTITILADSTKPGDSYILE